MASTDIEWAEMVWNLTRGCWPISPGCLNCYAMAQAHRFNFPGGPYEGLTEIGSRGPRWSGQGRFAADKLADPLRWRKPRRVFVNSMSDLFFEQFTFEQIAAAFGVMGAASQHTFMVLTKRSGRMVDWFEWAESENCDFVQITCAALDEIGFERGCGSAFDIMNDPDTSWPPPNVWLGVSVEDQLRAEQRIPNLLKVGGEETVRFLSAEPLLEPLELREWLKPKPGIDWVISGAESGVRARPAELPWFRSLRDQAVETGTKYFLKQIAEGADGVRRPRVVSLPVLDDRQWAEFPEAVGA